MGVYAVVPCLRGPLDFTDRLDKKIFVVSIPLVNIPNVFVRSKEVGIHYNST